MLAPRRKSFIQKQLSGIDSVEFLEYALGFRTNAMGTGGTEGLVADDWPRMGRERRGKGGCH